MISVSDQARDYILLKGGCVHVLKSCEVAMCCGSVNLGPTVRLGEPPQAKDYTMTVINGINVHLPNKLYSPHPLTIGLGEFLGLKNLRIEGWKLI